MSNEPNKPIEAEELTEKELEGVVGGGQKVAKGDEILVMDVMKIETSVSPCETAR